MKILTGKILYLINNESLLNFKDFLFSKMGIITAKEASPFIIDVIRYGIKQILLTEYDIEIKDEFIDIELENMAFKVLLNTPDASLDDFKGKPVLYTILKKSNPDDEYDYSIKIKFEEYHIRSTYILGVDKID